MGLNKLILLDRRNRLGGYMMILANGHLNEITLKLLCKGRNSLAANNAPLGVDDAQLFGHHQDRVIRL